MICSKDVIAPLSRKVAARSRHVCNKVHDKVQVFIIARAAIFDKTVSCASLSNAVDDAFSRTAFELRVADQLFAEDRGKEEGRFLGKAGNASLAFS